MSSVEVIDRHIVEVADKAINEAMQIHYFGKDADNPIMGDLEDQEFVELIVTAKRQPMHPTLVIAKAIGNGFSPNEEAPVFNHYLKCAWDELVDQYTEHGVDPKSSIEPTMNIINSTESYISGYATDLGILATKSKLQNPKLNAFDRWIRKIWVPEEDMHDRSLQFQAQATGMPRQSQFIPEHIEHMHRGIHVPTESIEQVNPYLTQQEPFTVESYNNVQALLGPVLGAIPRAIMPDEARHSRAYAHVQGKLLDAEPDKVIVAMRNAFYKPEMPGKEGIRDYDTKSIAAAIAGVLDLESMLLIQRELIKKLQIVEREETFTTPEAKKAWAELVDPDGEYGDAILDKKANLMADLREIAINDAQSKCELLPAIVGLTVVSDPRTHKLSFPFAA